MKSLSETSEDLSRQKYPFNQVAFVIYKMIAKMIAVAR